MKRPLIIGLSLVALTLTLTYALARQDVMIDRKCVPRLVNTTTAILMYVQDYDESLPPYTDNASLISLVSPYNRDKQAGVCPVNHQPYTPNLLFAGQTLAAFTDEQLLMPLLSDSVSHASGLAPLYSTLRGGVYREGKRVSFATSQEEVKSNAKNFLTALQMYALDYDETLPLSFKQSDLGVVTQPYIKLPPQLVFALPGKTNKYHFNEAIAGRTYGSFENLSTVEVFHLLDLPKTGSRSTGYLDGHLFWDTRPR